MKINTMFNNGRYRTCGVVEEVPIELTILMFQLIDELKIKYELDYLQVFNLKVVDGKQVLIHKMEEPEYYKEHILDIEAPILKDIFVIDDGQNTTMLLTREY